MRSPVLPKQRSVWKGFGQIDPTSPAGKNASGQLGLPPTAAPVIDMPGAQPDMSQNPNKATGERQQTGQTGQTGQQERLNKKQAK